MSSTPVLAVMKTTGMSAVFGLALSSSQAPKPSSTGMLTSMSTISGMCSSVASTAARPSTASSIS